VSLDLAGVPGLTWRANGQATLTGPLLQALERLDRRFLSWARELGAAEFRFGSFVPARELHKLDYFRSFPHLVTFPATLDPGEPALQDFARRDPLNDDGSLARAPIAPIRDALTPAACYHFYVHFQDRELQGPLDLTTVATCYRREKEYHPLQRQWNFSMREIVRLGTSDEVKAFLASFRERLERLFAESGVEISFEHATDPFFNPRSNPKFLAQKLDPVKTEMIFGGSLSIGSLNFHRNFFGETFAITRAGAPVFSGCVAFGLERWLFALLSRFGTDPARWPGALLD
jgi:hypothetical protein